MPPKQPLRLGLLAAAICLAADAPPKALHEDFEGPKPSWRRELTDADVTLHVHERSNRSAHDGQKSERFRFAAGAGSALYYSYPLPRIPIAADPVARLYIRGNQEGVQLLGRVVLPADVDPETKEPSFVLVPGSRYDATDRWQRLELSELPLHVERQARVLRATTKRSVPLDGAFLERLVVNVMGNPGESDVFLDDLTVTPVPEGAVLPPPISEGDVPNPGGDKPLAKPQAKIRLEQNRLTRDGRPWVFTMVSAPEADPLTLYRAGFQVYDAPVGIDPAMVRSAVQAGMLLMPGLALEANDEPLEPEVIAGTAAAYPELPSVAFWNLGADLGTEADPDARDVKLARVRAAGLKLHKLAGDAPKITTGEVLGLLPDYARKVKGGLDLIGVDPVAWGSMMEPLDLQRFLAQRRDLTAKSSPQATFWTLVPSSAPAEVRSAAWGSHTPPPWGDPRVLPEQLRMFAYAALASGYRGIGFRGDAELTRPSGRALLNEMAFLNAEVGIIEPFLAQALEPIPLLFAYPPDPPKVINPQGIGGSGGFRLAAPRPPGAAPNPLAPDETLPHDSIRVASFNTRDRKGQLLLLNDFGLGAQWQPGQMAINNLILRVPAPESAQAFEVSLGGVKWLNIERVPGGKQITVPDFGNTAIVVVTTDFSLFARFEASVNALRSKAIFMAIEQAQIHFNQVEEIHRRLADDDHNPKNSSAFELLQASRKFIKSADEALQREDYPLAWSEARRASRPLRILMRLHFDTAYNEIADITGQSFGEEPRVKPTDKPKDPPKVPKPKGPFPPTLVLPVSSPPLVAFNMLPRQYLWNDWIRKYRFGRNELTGGTFEAKDPVSAPGWIVEQHPIEGVYGAIKPFPGGWKGKQVLRFMVRPTQEDGIDNLAPFLDEMPIALVSPPVQVYADEIVRISVDILNIRGINPGGGGIIVRPSIGGETLQFRSVQVFPDWRKVVLYRQAPADGPLTVTLGLAGFGDVFFDDLRIERLTDPNADASGAGGANLAGRPRPRRRPAPGAEPDENGPVPRPSAAARPRPAGRSTR